MAIFPQLLIGHPPQRAGLAGAAPVPQDQLIPINGIFGDQNGWQKQAADWGNANTPFAWTSCFHLEGLMKWGQASHADALAQVIIAARQAAHGGRVSVISHSNGAQLTRMALQRNPAARLDDAFLLGAADYCDCNKNGWNALLKAGQVQRVFMGVSEGDHILQWNFLTPSFWGCTLGRDGPKNVPLGIFDASFFALPTTDVAGPVIVGQENGYDHGDWVWSGDGTISDAVRAILQIPPRATVKDSLTVGVT